ncbi:hypothetical protein DOT_5034 [Desulfosporosinus sp. OT]|nr:hypothetical protein DOT_5034 [Desulfosporosinus sp. OT]
MLFDCTAEVVGWGIYYPNSRIPGHAFSIKSEADSDVS